MIEGCLLCTSYRTCTACMQGYELQEDGKCRGEGSSNVILIALLAAGGVIVCVVLGIFV